jgi:hypothetical protein
MGAAATYVGYKFEHVNRRQVRGGWLVRGTVYWTLAPASLQDTGWTAFLQGWSNDGYKIGFLLKERQTIRNLVYGGVSLSALRPQADEVADLDATHGTPENFRWHVWGGRGQRQFLAIQPNIITFKVALTLSGGQAPQMIPVASRHRQGSFAQSVGGLWVIGPRRRAGAARRRKARARRRRY